MCSGAGGTLTPYGCYKFTPSVDGHDMQCFDTSDLAVAFCMNLMDTDVCIHGPNQCSYALVGIQGTTGMCCQGRTSPSTWTAAPTGSCSLSCLDGNVCGGPATYAPLTYILSVYTYTRTAFYKNSYTGILC